MSQFKTDEEILAFLREPATPPASAPQPAPPQFNSDEEILAFLREKPESSGILRQAADIPVSAAGGVIGGLKGVSDIFGAGNPVSLTLADYRKFYQDAMSPEGKADARRAAAIMQEAQDKGVLAQAGAAARAFAVNPLDTIAGAAGSLAPTIATGVLGKAVGLGAKGIQAAQIAMGAGQGAGFIKGSIYDATKQYLLEQGIPEDKAEAAAIEAQKYNGENWDQIALGLGLGAAASGIGLERIIGKAIGGGVKDASKNIVTAGIKAAVQEGVPEAAQGGQEQLAQNLALIRQGANIPAMRGVVSQATLEGLAGIAAGGPVGIADYVQTPDMVQRARQAAAAPASFVPTPEVDPALVAAEFGDVADSQQVNPVESDGINAQPPTVDEQAAAPIEQPSGPPINIPATGETIAVDNRTQADTGGGNERGSAMAVSSVMEQPQANERQNNNRGIREDSQAGDSAGLKRPVEGGEGGRSASLRGGSPENERLIRAKEGGSESGRRGDSVSPETKVTPSSSNGNETIPQDRNIGSEQLVVGGQVEQDQEGASAAAETAKTSQPGQAGVQVTPASRLAEFAVAAGRLPWATSLDGRPTGWKIQDGPRGAVLISLDGKEYVPFETDSNAYADILRERMKARAFAIDSGRKIAGSGPAPDVVKPQQPQSPPTAGDAASVKLFRGIAKTVDYTTGDEFYSASQDVASEYAAQDGKQGEVVETTLADVAKNPYRAFDKAEAAAALGIDLPVTDIGFDAAVKAKLQPMGHDAVIYEAGTDFEGGGEMEVHKFAPAPANSSPATGGESQQQPAAQTQQGAASGKTKARIRKNLKPNSGAVDLDIINDLVDYGKQFYRAGMTFGKWAGQMVKEFGQGVARFLRAAYDQIVKSYRESRFSDQTGGINVYHGTPHKIEGRMSLQKIGTGEGAQSFGHGLYFAERQDIAKGYKDKLSGAAIPFVDAVAAVAGDNVPEDAISFLRGYESIDAAIDGLRNTATSDSPIIRKAWAGKESELDALNKKYLAAADWIESNKERIEVRRLQGNLYTVDLDVTPEELLDWDKPIDDQPAIMAKLEATDWFGYAADSIYSGMDNPSGQTLYRYLTEDYTKQEASELLAQAGIPGLRYLDAGSRNNARLEGTRNYVIWDESRINLTHENGQPLAQSQVSAWADAHRKLTAESGGIDASILADIVEFGRAFYQRGMTFGKWSAQMVAEFGQSVARYLRMAYDRIVQAYKDSPLSSEAGSVGDVRPNERRQSRAAQRAKDGDILSPEAVEAMGDTTYERMRLFGDSGIDERAKAEIERLGGMEKVYDYLTSDAVQGRGLLPIEVAMAFRASLHFDALGNKERAGTVFRVASLGLTTMGQGANVAKLLVELRPETVEYYTQSLIEKEAMSVSEDFAKLIGESREDLKKAKEAFYKAKTDAIHDAVLGLQEQGEKIITKIKEILPDDAIRIKMLREIREVLQQDISRADAVKEVSELMKTYGISPFKAQAWSSSIVSTVFKLTNKAKTGIAKDMATKHKWRVRSWKKLLAEVETGNLSDADFVANLTALSGLPHISREVGAKLRKWTAEYRAATDEDIKTILATQIWEEVHSQVPPEIAQRLRASMYIAMLMYPLTWIKNIGGNLIQFGGNIARDAGEGSIVDPIVAKITGERKTAGRGNVRTKLQGLAAPYNVYKRGKAYARQQNPEASRYEQIRTGLRHLRLIAKATTQNKYSEADAKAIGGRAFQSKTGRFIEGVLSIALGAPDYAFWSAAYQSSLAQRKAAAQINGDWTGLHTWEMVEGAYEDAADAIFQKKNVVSTALAEGRKVVNKGLTLGLTDQIGPGTQAIAFSQVPGALFVKGMWDWSFGGFLNAAWQTLRPSMWRVSGGRIGGKFDQRAFTKAFTEAVIGAGGFVGGGFWLASMGIMTASDDDDAEVAAANRQQGIIKFSVNFSALARILKGDFRKQTVQDGDYMVPYDWAQPLAMPVAMGAEMAIQQERAKRKGLKTGEPVDMLKAGLWGAAKSMADQPLVSGMSQFIRTWGLTNNPFLAIAESYLALPGMFVPQVARKFAQYVDNTTRETRGGNMIVQEFNQIAAQMPWLSQQYPAKIDVTGQAVERYQDAGNTWYNLMLNPFVGKTVKTNPVLAEATRLLNVTGDPNVFPRQAGRTVEINKKKIELTNEQITRHNYFLGNMTMAMLTYRMGKPSYQRASDEEKAKMFVKDLNDVAAATRAGVYGLGTRNLSPAQKWIYRQFMKLPVAQSEPPRFATPPQ